MFFPVSGVEVAIWIPPLVSFCISFVTSMGGVSGAFLLLPFQMSVLGFTSPSVSPTNLVYNIVAIPGGVIRYIREGRMTWPLTWIIILGTLPGVGIGALIRIRYFFDPSLFKLFVAAVLIYIAFRLYRSVTGNYESATMQGQEDDTAVKTVSRSFRKIEYLFMGNVYSFSVPGVFCLSAAVGLIGGIYGIGGGAIIAPFLITVFRLPVYTVAGAALMGTLITSVFGVAFYQVLAMFCSGYDSGVAPDWLLGALFGIGGYAGIYLGARFQKYVPEKKIKIMLGICMIYIAGSYIYQYFA